MTGLNEDDDVDDERRGMAARVLGFHDRFTAKQLGRLFAFLVSGWFGWVLATVSVEFDEWEDFRDPQGAFDHDLLNPFLLFLWPLDAMITPPWSVLHLLLFFGLAGVALIYLSTPDPSPIWMIGFAGYGSSIPLISDDTAIPSFVVLAFFWAGLGGLGWYVLQARHPVLIEKAARRIRGERDDGRLEK